MWQMGYNLEATDNTYNPNDLGFLSKNNYINQNFSINQYITKPFWKILKMVNTLYFERENNFTTKKMAYNLFMIKTNMDWKNYLTVVSHIAVKPNTQRDFYDPRTFGYFVNIPKTYQSRTYFSSDYRKTLALDGYLDYVFLDEHHRDKLAYSIMPRIRASKRLLINYAYEYALFRNQKGFVTKSNDIIYLGKRDVKEINNSVKVNYVFNNLSSMQLVARHYWSGARYSEYYTLQNNGQLNPIADNLDADYNFNAWTLDLIFNWQFAPGSLMTIAWKNIVYENNPTNKFSYVDNFNSTFNQTLSNSFSVKILYYLDAARLRKLH
jgi:hypothetical protein